MRFRGPRRVNPKRELTEEESRIYAAGMAAHRRGEKRPATQLPPKSYAIWLMGWRRVGRVGFRAPKDTSRHDSFRKMDGLHVVRTEVATLDEALDVLAAEQKAVKVAKTAIASGAHKNWRQELNLAKISSSRRSAMKTAAVRRKKDAEDMEQRQVERISKAIDMLCLSVKEISSFAETNYSHNNHPMITQPALVNAISSLCKMINRPVPEFDTIRKPGKAKMTSRCTNCGATIEAGGDGYCLRCDEPRDDVHTVSEERRERVRDVRDIGRLIRKTEKALEHGYDKGHGRHSRQDSPGVETGGREEDFDLGGEAPHRAGEDDPGDAEG